MKLAPLPAIPLLSMALASLLTIPGMAGAQCRTTVCSGWAPGYGPGDSSFFLDNSRSDTLGIGTVISNCDTGQIIFNPYVESVVTAKGGITGTVLKLQTNANGWPLGYDPAYVGLNNRTKQFPRLDYFDLEQNNLFNFDRYRAAAMATNNNYALCDDPLAATCTVFDGTANVLCNNLIPAITSRATLYGIVRVILTPGNRGTANRYWCDGSPGSFDRQMYLGPANGCGSANYNFNGELNVKGTVMFDTVVPLGAPNPRTFQGKINQGIPLNVNWILGPVSNSRSLSFADYNFMRTTQKANASAAKPAPGYVYPSNYVQSWDEIKTSPLPAIQAKNPFALTLAQMNFRGVQYQPFQDSPTAPEDLPAVMYTGGFVDMHNQMNVSGLVYTPNLSEFCRIEQVSNWQRQATLGAPTCVCTCYNTPGKCFVKFINGALVSGRAHTNQIPLWFGGAYGAGTLIALDPSTMDFLVTVQPQFLTKTGFRVVK